MGIGDKIRQRRETIGMSQVELANKLGYTSRSSINKIEKDINDIPQSKIIAFAEALETTPAFLMDWKDEQNDNKSNIGKYLKQTRENKGMTKNVLSKLTNIPIEQINDFENSISIPNHENLIMLSEVLDCEVSRLLLGDELDRYDMSIIDQIDDIMMSDNEARKKLIKSAIDLPDEDVLFMEKVLDALNAKKADHT